MRGPPGLMLFPFPMLCCLLLMSPEEDECDGSCADGNSCCAARNGGSAQRLACPCPGAERLAREGICESTGLYARRVPSAITTCSQAQR